MNIRSGKDIFEYREKNQVAVVRLDLETFEQNRFLHMSYKFVDFCAAISSKGHVRVFAILLNAKKSLTATENETEPTNAEAPSLVDCISALEIPVIIGTDGYVTGKNLELALACDIRIATRESYFGFPEINQGVIPFQGGTQRLPRLVGKGMALEMILTGAVIDANTSRQIGLVSRIVKKNELNSVIMNMASDMSSKSPISTSYIKEAVHKGMDLTLEQGIRLEADLYYLIHTTHDRSEGIRAFQEKRPPEFKGS